MHPVDIRELDILNEPIISLLISSKLLQGYATNLHHILKGRVEVLVASGEKVDITFLNDIP